LLFAFFLPSPQTSQNGTRCGLDRSHWSLSLVLLQKNIHSSFSSGSGKTEVGRELAGLLHWQFIDAGLFHSRLSYLRLLEFTPFSF
jgi:hypothetical protein